MESSQVIVAAEECHSSESGWTMYIGSPEPGEEDNSHLNGEYEDFGDQEHHEYNHDENSDDSMASDASSGPSHREQSSEIKKGNRPEAEAKFHRNDYSNYKAKKDVKKNKHGSKKENKDEPHEVAGNGTKYLVKGSKVKKI